MILTLGGIRFFKREKTVRIGKGQRIEDDRFDDAEDRRIGADPEGERKERNQRKSRSLSQPPPSVAQILPEGLHLSHLTILINGPLVSPIPNRVPDASGN